MNKGCRLKPSDGIFVRAGLMARMTDLEDYSELNLNQYSVASPCRTICTVCGSPPCPDLNLIHYKVE
ncbi:hypothetical protein [Neisseria lactamica]